MVSVIIPTYNEEKVLPSTLSSLLEHSSEYRIIVVDGGSTDRTQDIARNMPRVTFISAPKGRAVYEYGARSGKEDLAERHVLQNRLIGKSSEFPEIGSSW